VENYVITFNAVDNGNSLNYCYENITGKTPRDALNLRFGKPFKRLTGDAAGFAEIIIVKGTYCPKTNTVKPKGRYVRLCYAAA